MAERVSFAKMGQRSPFKRGEVWQQTPGPCRPGEEKGVQPEGDPDCTGRQDARLGGTRILTWTVRSSIKD